MDLILSFSLKNPTKDTVMDPACGTGTFLIQAYFQKRLLDPTLDHKEILSSLWGVDIAKFPAHLSTINLALRNLREKDNYPQIFQNDFFALKLGGLVDHPSIDAKEVNRHDGTIQKIHYPRTVDVIVGNPPYTRQEEISKISGKEEAYKENLIQAALKDAKGRQIAKISRRAGIHAYFFIHGFKFLKNGGRFGFIVSNSWMDADYGKDLQEFFLKNYKVVAIIESKIERWFTDADINTCIIILEKAEGQANAVSRDTNLVRFVQLKKPLTDFIPSFSTNKADQKERLSRIEKLKELVLVHDKYFEDEKIRIRPKLQKELWKEGLKEEAQTYAGTKWGKYLRHPEIFFKIVKKGEGKLLNLAQVASFGGYIHDNNVKDKFPKTKIILSSQSIDKITAYESDKNVVMKGVKPSGNSRSVPDIVVGRTFNDTFLVVYNADRVLFKRFYKILAKNKKHTLDICLVLNSTLQILFWECIGITEGLGALNIYKDDFDKILIPAPKYLTLPKQQFESFMNREIKDIFEEIGAFSPEEVSLAKVKPDRRKLDKIILGDILGLTEEEQLEVYKGVVDLVSSRLQKAKSVNGKKKSKEKIIEEKQVEQILNWIGKSELPEIWQKYNPANNPKTKPITVSQYDEKAHLLKSLFGWQVICGRQKFDCKTKDEAELLLFWILMGREEIALTSRIPSLALDLTLVKKEYDRIHKILNDALDGIIDEKLKSRIRHLAWENLLNRKE